MWLSLVQLKNHISIWEGINSLFESPLENSEDLDSNKCYYYLKCRALMLSSLWVLSIFVVVLFLSLV